MEDRGEHKMSCGQKLMRVGKEFRWVHRWTGDEIRGKRDVHLVRQNMLT